MKNIKLFILALLSITVFNSCVVEDGENPYYPPNEYGVYPIISNVINGYFDLADTANANIGFTITPSNSGGAESSSGEVHVNFNGGDYRKIADMNSFPHTSAFSLQDVTNLLNIDINDLVLGDSFDFKYYFAINNGETMTSTESLAVPMSCQSNLSGTYSVTTTYGYHDFLPTYSTNTMNIEIVEVADGLYEVYDFSGGLYSSGPYSTEYGTDDSSFTVQFRDTCNNISWSGQSDPWGSCIPNVEGDNYVDSNTGIITISWLCEGYGENGISIYTPL